MYGEGVEQNKMDRELEVIKMCVFILNWDSHLQFHQIEPRGHFPYSGPSECNCTDVPQ